MSVWQCARDLCSYLIWVKYGIRDLQVMLLSIHEVHENWHWEIYTFCIGVLKLDLCMYYKTVWILKVRTVLVWGLIIVPSRGWTSLNIWEQFNKSKFFPEEIKSRLRLGNACYHSVQNLLSSRLLSKNFKIKIYRTIILPVVLYGCETWSLTLWEERKLGVFENKVLRRIFGPRRDEVTGEWRRLHNKELND